jgi:1-deoxy-D-xylulose-5-phosphate synthase
MPISTPLLDTIKYPADLRKLKPEDLEQVAKELRDETIDAASVTGGHFGAGLGVVELTVALHYAYNTPDDRLIWDVSHQAYPHKILTGRRDRIRKIRQSRRALRVHQAHRERVRPVWRSTLVDLDFRRAGHGRGARPEGQADNHVIAVIGDGSMSAGMAYEAMNNAGALDSRMLVVLNDNGMSIAPGVGALTNYLSWLVSTHPFLSIRDIALKLSNKFPKTLRKAAERVDEYARGMVMGGTLFEELGFYYVGPVDGHDLETLVPVLQNIREAKEVGPVLLARGDRKGPWPSVPGHQQGKAPRGRQVRSRDLRSQEGDIQRAELYVGVSRSR